MNTVFILFDESGDVVDVFKPSSWKQFLEDEFDGDEKVLLDSGSSFKEFTVR